MGRLFQFLLLLSLLPGSMATGHVITGHARAGIQNYDEQILSDTLMVEPDGNAISAPMEEVEGDHNADGPIPRLDGDVVYSSVDQMPQFPGGLNGLMEFLNTNIVYPTVAAEKNIEGKVLIQFVVEKDGSVGEIKILRSIDPNLDYEAIRLCKMMPKFIPGMLDGKPVRVWYTLPINFMLTE